MANRVEASGGASQVQDATTHGEANGRARAKGNSTAPAAADAGVLSPLRSRALNRENKSDRGHDEPPRWKQRFSYKTDKSNFDVGLEALVRHSDRRDPAHLARTPVNQKPDAQPVGRLKRWYGKINHAVTEWDVDRPPLEFRVRNSEWIPAHDEIDRPSKSKLGRLKSKIADVARPARGTMRSASPDDFDVLLRGKDWKEAVKELGKRWRHAKPQGDQAGSAEPSGDAATPPLPVDQSTGGDVELDIIHSYLSNSDEEAPPAPVEQSTNGDVELDIIHSYMSNSDDEVPPAPAERSTGGDVELDRIRSYISDRDDEAPLTPSQLRAEGYDDLDIVRIHLSYLKLWAKPSTMRTIMAAETCGHPVVADVARAFRHRVIAAGQALNQLEEQVLRNENGGARLLNTELSRTRDVISNFRHSLSRHRTVLQVYRTAVRQKGVTLPQANALIDVITRFENVLGEVLAKSPPSGTAHGI